MNKNLLISTAILIPILEIISTLCAVAISMYYVKKLGYTVKVTNLRACITKICGSAIYFVQTLFMSSSSIVCLFRR